MTVEWIDRFLFMLVLLSLSSAALAQQSAPAKPALLLNESLRAMGGEESLRGIHSVELKGIEQRNLLEQSERPEGPYIVASTQFIEDRDFAARRWRRTTDSQLAWLKFGGTTLVVNDVAARVNGNTVAPGSPQDVVDAGEALDLAPERVLFTALTASDVHTLPDTVLHSVPHHVVQFTWQNIPVRIYINADTHLPSAVEWTRGYPYHTFWSVWGDVTTRIYYSMWWLGAGDVRFPVQEDVFRNGLPDRKLTFTSVRINAPATPQSFEIPASAQTAFKARAAVTADKRPLPVQNAQEVAPGVILFAGAWNTTIVRQDDGVVILEAPISSGYSAQVIAEAAKRFPAMKIKAVISTSDSWPHVGGVREYVALGVPVYVLDRTRPFLERIVNAPRTQFPDTLARSPRAPRFITVSGKTVIGTGPNRIEIYPIHGQTAERQMMAYFPERKLLYGSDAFQKSDDGSYFYPQTVSEVRDAVAREHLTVERFFMMHLGPTPWSEVLAVKGVDLPN